MSDIAKQLEVDADEIVDALRRKWIERQSLLLLFRPRAVVRPHRGVCCARLRRRLE